MDTEQLIQSVIEQWRQEKGEIMELLQSQQTLIETQQKRIDGLQSALEKFLRR